MGRFLVDRLAQSAVLLVGVSIIGFALMRLPPGGPLAMYTLNPTVTAQDIQRIKVQFGLDQPVWVQYFKWAAGVFTGNWGYSFFGLWNGSATISVMSGTHAVPLQAEEEVNRALGPRHHRTLSLHDHVYIGGDGRIDRARAMQVIEATAQGVDRIPFLCDTNVLTLEVVKAARN